jgi:hypothetical protein
MSHERGIILTEGSKESKGTKVDKVYDKVYEEVSPHRRFEHG